MAEFSLHLRLDADEYDLDDTEPLLAPYVQEYDAVEFGSAEVPTDESDTPVPEESLEIDDIDVFADVYTDLRDEPGVSDVSLWGPASERFPVPVQHYALQQLSDPDLYEFYALDARVTLVVCDSRRDLEQLRMEIPSAALG